MQAIFQSKNRTRAELLTDRMNFSDQGETDTRVYISFQNIPRKFHSHMAPMLLETGKSILTHEFMKLIIKAYVSKSDDIF